MKKKNIIAAIAILCLSATAKAQTATTQPPTLYALTQESDALPPSGGIEGGKTLGIFRSERQAKTWTTIAGFTLITLGACTDGNAEMHRMYHGTTGNGDRFHVTRDIGHLVTGAGAASLGLSIGIGGKIKPLELIWKGLAAPILYRIAAEATYNATKPH